MKKKKLKRRMLFALEMLVLLLFIGGLYVYGQISARMDKLVTNKVTTSADGEEVSFDSSKVVTNDTAPTMTGYRTYALFGIDHRSKNAALGSENSDTIIIASVNNDTQEVKLVSIYRDTLLNIGNDTYAKANAAYAYGGPEQAISMLNTNLDLNITDYATVDFNALVEAVDAVGGLEIPLSYAEIEHMNNYCKETAEETDKSYTPIELPTPKPDDLEATVDIYHLNGVQVTSYCRIRYTASLDMGRTERQRRVIQMLTQKMKKAGLTTIFNIMDDVFPMVETSLTKTEILNMIPTVIGYHVDETTGFPFNYKFSNARGSIIVADSLESNVKQLHEFLYGTTDYTPSQNILDASNKIIEIAGGADSLQDTAPATTEDDGTGNNEFFWQDDGNGGNAWDNGSGGYSNPDSDSSGDNSSGDSNSTGGDTDNTGGNTDNTGGGDYSGGDDYSGGGDTGGDTDYTGGDTSGDTDYTGGGDTGGGDTSGGDTGGGDYSGGDDYSGGGDTGGDTGGGDIIDDSDIVVDYEEVADVA